MTIVNALFFHHSLNEIMPDATRWTSPLNPGLEKTVFGRSHRLQFYNQAAVVIGLGKKLLLLIEKAQLVLLLSTHIS